MKVKKLYQVVSSLSIETCSSASQCAGNDDVITIKAEDAGDTVSFMFESPNQDRIAGRAQYETLP